MKKQIILLFLTFGVTACSTFSTNRFDARLNQDASVLKAGSEIQDFKKGETVVLGDKPTLISSPGYVGILVLPASEYKGTVEIDLKSVKSYGGEAFTKKYNQNINEVVAEITEIQLLIAKNKPQDALERTLNLQQKYPQLSYIHLLKASAYVLQHDEKRALQSIELALRDFPDNKQAQDLYYKLSGKRSLASEKKNGD